MSKYIKLEDAIEALYSGFVTRTYIENKLSDLPTIEMVTCEECNKHCDCERILAMTTCYGEIEDYAELDFCSYGERKEE